MIKEIQLRLTPREASSEKQIKEIVALRLGEQFKHITAVRVLKRSIDARQRSVVVNLSVRVFLNEAPPPLAYETVNYRPVDGTKQAVVVGAGPAGLFASLKLIELGVKPIMLERGKNVTDRKRDIALISREQSVNPESNYSFGEGGAGAFSDGKLYTRSKKRGNVNEVLNVLCQHGASDSILVDAHPHIGTDKLPRVISNIRQTILDCGGEIHFNTRVDDLVIENNEVTGVTTQDNQFFGGKVILATGHSARDTYRMLHAKNITLEAKGIAMGVRLEHPQQLIDQIQYHTPKGRGDYLPAAEYSFVTQSRGRGVYSFCMCPGGFVVPAASGPQQVVVNGMSPSNRGSQWANAGFVVEIRPEDFPDKCENDVLGLIALQEELEYNCFINGGMKQTAPAQRMNDFVNKKLSYDLPDTSYVPGILSSPLHFWMPEFITSRLREGFVQFGKSSRGFLTNEAVMIGVETRTSAPVRVPRDIQSLEHVQIKGLYPCGEGAGYAGGIVSAAIDGQRCAESLATVLSK